MKGTIVLTFLNPLSAREIGEGVWQLLHAFYVMVCDQEIIVPPMFTTDFASVPRLPFAYALFGGLGNRAAVLHDYLYSERKFDRETCDKVFYAALVVCGVSKWKAYMMYLGVRVGGGSYWDNPRERPVA